MVASPGRVDRQRQKGKLQLAEMGLLQAIYWMEVLRKVEGVLPGDKRQEELFCSHGLLDGWVNAGAAHL